METVKMAAEITQLLKGLKVSRVNTLTMRILQLRLVRSNCFIKLPKLTRISRYSLETRKQKEHFSKEYEKGRGMDGMNKKPSYSSWFCYENNSFAAHRLSITIVSEYFIDVNEREMLFFPFQVWGVEAQWIYTKIHCSKIHFTKIHCSQRKSKKEKSFCQLG